MSEVMEKILALWEIDRALHRLEGTLSDLAAEERRLLSRIQAEDQAWEDRKRQHQELRSRANAKALEVDETDDRIRAYQKKLDHDIIPYKEMEYLKEQVEYLRERLEELEEEALALMDEVEADAERLVEDEKEHLSRRRRLEAELAELKARQDKLAAEREGLLSRREQALADLPQHWREHYERLHETVPDPVAPVENGTCGGCHLKISDTLMEKVREGREVVICENCLRFLYLGWR
jgi:predicted  nucleic acid-binding Zn-ribbon protein